MDNGGNREIITTKALLKMYANFAEVLNLPKTSVYVNPATVLNVAKHYWRDVDRMHAFQDFTLIDCHKIAGYYAYWLGKLKPISITDVNAYSPKFSQLFLNINECFAFYVGVGRVNDCLKKTGKTLIDSVPKNFFEAIIYTLNYRSTSGDNLSLMYYLTEKAFS